MNSDRRTWREKALVLLLVIGAFCNALSQSSYSIEDILSAPFASDLVAAPVGNQVAWVINQEGSRNVWLAKGPQFESVKLTDFVGDDGQDIGDLTFSRDGNTLFFVRGGSPNRNGEFPNPRSETKFHKQQIWAVDLSSRVCKPLTEGANYVLRHDDSVLTYIKSGQVWQLDLAGENAPYQLFEMRGSPSSLRWSPDTERNLLAFVSNRGDHSFVGIFDADNDKLKYLAPSVDHDHFPSWSKRGKKLAFVREPNEKQRLIFKPRRDANPWSILVHDLEVDETTTLWTAAPGTGSAYRFISGSRQLFWLDNVQLIFPYEQSGWTHLYSRSLNEQELAIEITKGNFEVQFVGVSDDRTEILYSSNQGDIDRQHIWKFSSLDRRPVQVTSGEGIEWGAVITDAGQILTLASSYNKPAHVALVQDDGRLQSLTDHLIPAAFPTEALVKPEQVVFSAADGMQIHGQLFLPKNRDKGRPASIFLHGGSRRQMKLGYHHSLYYHHAYALNQYLASQGYVVLSVNYRSGIGYGMEFREAIDYGAEGASEFNDVLGAGLYLRSREDVDPEKITLWGGSYGGYLTALGLARASDLFAAGVDIHGVHDWNVVIKNFVPGYDAEKEREIAALAFESSPMAYIEGWRSPVLIIHGDDDRNVPFSESVDLVEELRKQGVYFEQLIFPDEVHGFLLHANWLSAYRSTADFLNRMLAK